MEAVRELTDGRGAEVVFEAIGHPVTFRQATEMAADGGRVVAVGIAPAGVAGEVEITGWSAASCNFSDRSAVDPG